MANIPKTIVDVVQAIKNSYDTLLAGKVDKVTGKGLSTNDYTNADKTIVDGVTSALSGKWDKPSQKVAGAYNLLPQDYVSTVISPVTFTVNADKTISATASARTTSNVIFPLIGNSSTYADIANKGQQLKFCCAPTGYNCTVFTKDANGNSLGYQDDNGQGVILPANAASIYAYAKIHHGANPQGIIFKPMLTPDLNATYDDYVPYCMSNRELMTPIQITNFTANTTYITTLNTNTRCYRLGNLVFMNILGEFAAVASGTSGFNFISGLPKAKLTVNAHLFRSYTSLADHISVQVSAGTGEIIPSSNNGYPEGWYSGTIIYIAED